MQVLYVELLKQVHYPGPVDWSQTWWYVCSITKMFQEGSIRWNRDNIISGSMAQLSSAKADAYLAPGFKYEGTFYIKITCTWMCKPKGNNCYISPPHNFKSLKGVIHHKLWPKKVLLQHFSEGLVSKSSLPNLVALLWVWFKQYAVS